MKAYALSDIGKVRAVNEDSYYLPAQGERFAAVADGMGGHQAGEVASALAIKVFSENLRLIDKPSYDAFEVCVEEANHAIYEAAQLDRAKRGMGTTLTALWMGEEDAYLAHVGDSRGYLLRNGVLMQLSCDHSLVNEMVAKGEITPAEALIHPQRNFITRALGTGRRVQADVMHLDVRPGDVWLLCSDGLSNYVTSGEMAEILGREIDWPDKLRALIDLALARGGSDNITAVVVTAEEAGA